MPRLFLFYSLLLIAVCTDSYDVRLVGGTSSCNGRLEMGFHGEWRPVLAWFDWNRMSSSVVCRQLNCGSAVSTEFTASPTRQPGWMIPSSCVGSESSLMECGPVKSYNSTITLKLTCSGKKLCYVMLLNVLFKICHSSSCVHDYIIQSHVHV